MKLTLALTVLLFVVGCKTPDIPDIPNTSTTTSTTSTTTTTIPPVAGDHPASIHVAGPRIAWDSLKETCKITNFRFDANGFWGEYSGQEIWASADGMTCGWIVMVYKVNGQWDGEYWDGMSAKSPYLTPSLWHITDPSSPFAGNVPKKGDKIGMLYVSEDCQNRSNIVWSEWPL
jgi:hypothetical protein